MGMFILDYKNDFSNEKRINIRRSIYMILMSSSGSEEAGHKLAKVLHTVFDFREMVGMLIECTGQEDFYSKFYALLGSQFCLRSSEIRSLFECSFEKYYLVCSRFCKGKVRNVARFFGHLLAGHYISSDVLNLFGSEVRSLHQEMFIRVLLQYVHLELGGALFFEWYGAVVRNLGMSFVDE